MHDLAAEWLEQEIQYYVLHNSQWLGFKLTS